MDVLSIDAKDGDIVLFDLRTVTLSSIDDLAKKFPAVQFVPVQPLEGQTLQDCALRLRGD